MRLPSILGLGMWKLKIEFFLELPRWKMEIKS
jgi:hypothetical protein